MIDLEARPRIEVVTALILDDDGRMLMARRRAGRPRPGMWENPGGKVEPTDKTYREALRRELREELGVDSKVRIDPVTVIPLRVEIRISLFLFPVDIIGEPQALESDELRWLDPVDAITNYPCAPATYSFFDEVVNYIQYTRTR